LLLYLTQTLLLGLVGVKLEDVAGVVGEEEVVEMPRRDLGKVVQHDVRTSIEQRLPILALSSAESERHAP
jgi:hypothetical protein